MGSRVEIQEAAPEGEGVPRRVKHPTPLPHVIPL